MLNNALNIKKGVVSLRSVCLVGLDPGVNFIFFFLTLKESIPGGGKLGSDAERWVSCAGGTTEVYLTLNSCQTLGRCFTYYFILEIALQKECYYLHLSNEKTEAQRVWVTSSGFHSK